MGIVKTDIVGPSEGVNLNLISGTGGYVLINGQIITGSGSVIIGPMGNTGSNGSTGATGATGSKGDKGDQGDQGIPGLDGYTSPAGLTWSGPWNGTQSYFKNYVVGYASASWWSKANIAARPFPLSPNSPPDIDTSNWALLSTQGPVGPQGIRGATGPVGATGLGLQGIRGATGATGGGVASNVTYIPDGISLTASNVQGALDQLVNRIFSYKIYTALLTQSGTASPVATILENSFDNTPIWTRDSLGTYIMTSTGIYENGKTFIPGVSLAEDGSSFTYIMVGSAGSLVGQYTFYYGSANEIYLETQDNAGDPIEFSSLFENGTSIPFEIRKYN